MDNLESIVRQKGWLDLTLKLLQDASNEKEFERLSGMYDMLLRLLGKSEQAKQKPGLVMSYTGKYLTVYYSRLEKKGKNTSEIYNFRQIG